MDTKVPFMIEGSQLNRRCYRLEYSRIPAPGDLFKDDGDVVKVINRTWDRDGYLTLQCEEVRRSMFR